MSSGVCISRKTPKLGLDGDRIERCRELAARVTGAMMPDILARSTDSMERTILRFWGVEGATPAGVPFVNEVVDRLKRAHRLERGVAAPIAALVAKTQLSPQQVCAMIAAEDLALPREEAIDDGIARETANRLTQQGLADIRRAVEQRRALREELGQSPPPWIYLIVATGNIHEDVKQARSAVSAGADCIAVIRTTAQSLLDYVPEGATTEGFGGTYATGENFRIMRRALNDAARQAGRYVRLTNYASGLCMPEISVLAARNGLDMLLNDSMYGIIFRNIHRQRTLVDQYLSRRICAEAEIIINTGEDNYLTTADAIEAAHTVLASQLINESFARAAGMPSNLMGLGHAFEVNPMTPDSYLYELASALLAREVFPDAPLKYMPPTRYMTGDIFFGHRLDGMFDLASVLTDQSIHLCGILTEAVHTPFIADRFVSTEGARYARIAAGRLKDEITFKQDGFIARRAAAVLEETEKLLEHIADIGLLQSLADGVFADIKRPPDQGRGGDGVFVKAPGYLDPFEGRLAS